MSTRQATKALSLLLTLFTVTAACTPAPAAPPRPTSTPVLPTHTSSPTPPPSPVPSVTPRACLAQPGRVEEGALDSTRPPQHFRIYLPPCYDEEKEQRYPVLYLLHGQTYTDDQWIRLGAVKATDGLILSGASGPFLIVFPDDRYWNLPPGAGLGRRLVDELIPYVDSTYRTLADRNHRALGGLSRGAGWALRLGLTRWELFGAVGLHSLAVLQGDGSEVAGWLAEIPPRSRPRVFMDIGDNDPELSMASRVESYFNESGLTHEWHLYSGAHTEEYWSAHAAEYMGWYAQNWNVR